MTDELIGTVFASAGYWVVKCPRPFCHGAEHFGGRRGGMGVELGGLGPDGMLCKECRSEFPVRWPADRAEIERVLMERPDPMNRNWLPHETLMDLVFENLAHGIAHVPALLATRPGPTEAQPLTSSDIMSLLFPESSVRALKGSA